ncbi:MAG: hypothetical protein U1F48_00120 [Burkholderiales bacterium]
MTRHPLRLLALAALSLLLAAPALAQRVVAFDHGAASIVLPDTFVTIERNDGTLRAVFGPAGDHRLDVVVRDVAGPPGATDAGVQYVRAEAKARDLRVFEYPQRVAYLQPVVDQEVDGKAMRAAAWYVGFGNHMALITLVAPTASSPDLQRFLAKGLDQAVTSVRRTAVPRPPG